MATLECRIWANRGWSTCNHASSLVTSWSLAWVCDQFPMAFQQQSTTRPSPTHLPQGYLQENTGNPQNCCVPFWFPFDMPILTQRTFSEPRPLRIAPTFWPQAPSSLSKRAPKRQQALRGPHQSQNPEPPHWYQQSWRAKWLQNVVPRRKSGNPYSKRVENWNRKWKFGAMVGSSPRTRWLPSKSKGFNGARLRWNFSLFRPMAQSWI